MNTTEFLSERRRSERLIAVAGQEVKVAAQARLLREMTDGTVSETAYARYLRIEEEFVRTAARVLGMAVWDAPGWDALTRHAASLHALTTEQAEYFAQARQQWPVQLELGPRGHAQAGGLSERVLDAARDFGYPAVVTGMLAAEHLYLTWCTRALDAPEQRPKAVQEWIALHTRSPFTEQVEVLRAEVDALSGSISDEQLYQWFVGTLREETRFHDAAYVED